MDYRFSLTN